MIVEVGEAIASVSWTRLSPAAKAKLEQCVIANFSAAIAGVPYTRLPEPKASGFYQAHAGIRPQFEDIAKDFDADRAVLDTVIKRYPVSEICQPVVRLAERVALREPFSASGIARVTIFMNPFEMRYPGTMNKGPDFRSFSDVLMSAAFCCATVLANGRFEFSDLFELRRPDRDALIAATEVRDDPALPTLSCRIDIELKSGGRLSDALIDGGNEVAIDASSIDEWASGLWREAGRTDAQYLRFREAVEHLEHAPAARLIDALVP